MRTGSIAMRARSSWSRPTLRSGGVDGTGFVPTPFARSRRTVRRLGFDADGGVWVKDETGGVAGSQKARHLITILLHLLAAERLGHLTERPRLAIASCGNAALAAATLAAAVDWPIDVYVPTWMTDGVRRPNSTASAPRSTAASAVRTTRPAIRRCSASVTPSTPERSPSPCRGPRTPSPRRWPNDRMGDRRAGHRRRSTGSFVQVGGGAFATCLGAGLADTSPSTRLHAVQTEGCAPLARAWDRARSGHGPLDDIASTGTDGAT